MQQHSARQPGSPLILVPTTSHTVDFAALQLCSLQSFADPLTAALAVCWDRSACTALHAARLPAVLDETATYEAVQAEAKARMAKKAIAQRRHDPDTFVPGSVFLPNGRALQWLKFYLLRRVSALLAHTGTPVFVVDSDVLWLQPAARALEEAENARETTSVPRHSKNAFLENAFWKMHISNMQFPKMHS